MLSGSVAIDQDQSSLHFVVSHTTRHSATKGNIVMGLRSIIMESSSLSVIGNTYDYTLLAN